MNQAIICFPYLKLYRNLAGAREHSQIATYGSSTVFRMRGTSVQIRTGADPREYALLHKESCIVAVRGSDAEMVHLPEGVFCTVKKGNRFWMSLGVQYYRNIASYFRSQRCTERMTYLHL